MRQVEESAKNVDLAIEKALTKLGITQNQAEIEVLSTGGLFKQAKVRVTKKQTSTQNLFTHHGPRTALSLAH